MGERVLVMGLGRSGRAAAALGVQLGHEVVGVDLREDVPPIEGVRLELGPHRRQSFLEADRVVVSPGIPATQSDLAAAHRAGVEVVGELAWADAHLHAPCAAITGTNGKSTVTWFVGQLLKAAGLRSFVGGNLGNPMSNALLEPQDWDCVVAEVSSYQLEWPAALRPRIGVVLNLTPDHLARHGDMDGYAAAKCRLFARMEPSDFAVIPANDPIVGAHAGFRGTRLWLGDLPGVLRHGDEAHIVVPSLGIDTMLDLSGLAVPGDHNKANAATAALVALVMGATPELVQEAIGRLQPLAHRMEVVADVDGVRWINDSKATNVDAARVGLAGLDQPAVVLLGGQAKGPGFAALASVLEPHPAVLCFGASGQAIADELTAAGVACETHASMQAAVQQAARIATGGQAVLLSPGCASFDEFNDFEHRGRVFADLARALTSETRDG